MKTQYQYLFIALIALASLVYSQIDVSDVNYLKSSSYYMTVDTGQSVNTANLIFKFAKDAGKYQYMISKDTLIIEFYGAYFDPKTIQGKVGSPFTDMKVTSVKENMRAIEGITQNIMDIVRFEFKIPKGFKPIISTANVRQVVTVNLSWPKNGETASEENEYSTKTSTYFIIAGAAVLVVTGIVYLIQSTSKEKTDEVIQR